MFNWLTKLFTKHPKGTRDDVSKKGGHVMVAKKKPAAKPVKAPVKAVKKTAKKCK